MDVTNRRQRELPQSEIGQTRQIYCSRRHTSRVNLTDVPDDEGDADADAEPPDFEEWRDPAESLKDGPTRERVLDVVLGLREPTKVSAVAERADCDPETARDYLRWFADIGVAREVSEHPVRYERNDSYLRWRRRERVRSSLSDEEIAKELAETLDGIEEYREKYDAGSPEEVSLLGVAESSDEVESVWRDLSDWKTLEGRAETLDAARREGASEEEVGDLDDVWDAVVFSSAAEFLDERLGTESREEWLNAAEGEEADDPSG